MHKNLLLVLILVSSISITSVQSQITEINDRKVEFKEDGTWKYLDEDENQEQEEEKSYQKKNQEDEIISPSDDFDARRTTQERTRAERGAIAKTSKCSDLLRTTIMEDYSGIQVSSEEIFIIGKNSFSINWTNNKKEGLQFTIQFRKPQCISNETRVSFSFRDISENFSVSNTYMDNCDGLLKINDQRIINYLESNTIVSISIKTREGTSTSYLKKDAAKQFFDSCNCIYNNAMQW